MFFKKFPFALQTIFSLHNLEADNFFQPTTACQGSIYGGGGGGGAGKASPQTSQLPPSKKFSWKKNLKLFQIKIFFDDDFKKSVKVTNVQNCDFSQSWTLYFQNFPGGMPPDSPKRPKKLFSHRRVAQNIFHDRLPPPPNKIS